MARDRRTGVAAILLTAMAVTGCEAPVEGVDPSVEPLIGEWIGCLNDGAGDYSKQMQFYGDSFSSTTRRHDSVDGTCAGAETSASLEIWRFRLEGEVPAQIGAAGTEVLAREMNIQNSFETLFTIVYVDATSTPRRLYLGDLALDPLQDGTTPERRPDLLSTSTALTTGN